MILCYQDKYLYLLFILGVNFSPLLVLYLTLRLLSKTYSNGYYFMVREGIALTIVW